MIGMPMVGLLIGKIDARKMVAIGLLGGAVTLIWLGQLNLNAGYWDIFWPQFFQGLALSRAVRAADHDQHGSDPA